MIIHDLFEEPQLCPECGGISFSDLILAEKKDACYYKVKASAKVWPSAYASGRLVQCRKKGADSYGNKSEGVMEMDKSQTPPGRDGSNDSDAGKKEYTAKATTPKKVAKDGEKILNKELNKKQGVVVDVYGRNPSAKTLYKGKNAGGSEVTISYEPDYWPGHSEKYIIRFDGRVKAEMSSLEMAVRALTRDIYWTYRPDIQPNPKTALQQSVAEEYELAGVGVAYELGRRAYKQGMTIRDNPYSATREARKNDEWAKGLERGKHDANDARHFRSSVREQGVAEATGDQKFDSMMSRMTTEPKYPDRQMPPTSIAELVQWADQNNKPYHKFFAQWAQKHKFTNVNDALVWVGDNVDPYDEFGPKDHENDFGDLVGEPLIDAAKHNPKAAELLKVFKCYEEIIDDWDDEYRQMNLPENQLDEKSVSQAQFRTMAAAAHNPKFVKKVGISQNVAREFHGADRKQDYADLPKKADESKSAPKEKEADYGDDYQDMVARVKKLAGLGPLKTVYDPARRVYRNVPTAVQPKR